MIVAERTAMLEPAAVISSSSAGPPLSLMCAIVSAVAASTVSTSWPSCCEALMPWPRASSAMVRCRLARLERRVDGVEIVLADEQHGQPMHGREVDALVEHAGLGRGIAEEDDGERAAICSMAPKQAPTRSECAADDRHAAEEIDDRSIRCIEPPCRGAAVDLAVELGDIARRSPPCDVMRVRAVRADDVVLAPQVAHTPAATASGRC